MNRSWSGFVFRQVSFYRNFRQQWSRFKSRAVQYSFNLYRNDRRFTKFAIAASTVGFTFREHGISEDRMSECHNCEEEFVHRKTPGHGWELLYEEKDMLAFRRRIEGPYEMYEYKCVGTYYDISPRNFLDAQNDLDYRRQWDENIVTIEVVKEENENELIRWVSKFPYPMYPREYVYVRRTWVSDDEKYAVLDSESVQPEVFPSISESNVRVRSYTSRMSIRAHTDWESHGVDYILTYSDNPEANIPRYVYNWMVNKGGPYFLKQVHKAARDIETSGRHVRSATEKALLAKNDRVSEREAKEKEEKRRKESEVTRENQENNGEKKCPKSQKTRPSSATNSFVLQSDQVNYQRSV
uniref:Phosphatidylcholine transfer protein n=1 Tax=Caenorhabditis tropicalis TaxID=1561998 RepID=A0A1I7SZZ1_9PELO